MIIRREILQGLKPIAAHAATNGNPKVAVVHVEPDGRVVATDRQHVLLVAQDTRPFPDAEFPSVGNSVPEHAGDPELAIDIPVEHIDRLLKAMPRRSPIPILAAVQVSRDDDGATIAAMNLKEPCVVHAPASGQGQTPQFPRYDRVLPDYTGAELRVLFMIEVLETLIKAAKGCGTNRIELRIPTGAAHQGRQQTADHPFTDGADDWRAAKRAEDRCVKCGERRDLHTGPDGVVIDAVGVRMSADGIEIIGAAMPARP